MSSGYRDPYEKARQRGVEVIVNDDNTILQLDLDSEPTPLHIQAWDTWGEIQGFLDTKSPGGRRHRYVKLSRPWPLQTRIGLQAALGSDPVREIISLQAILTIGDQKPESVLFETPAEAARVRHWIASWADRDSASR